MLICVFSIKIDIREIKSEYIHVWLKHAHKIIYIV